MPHAPLFTERLELRPITVPIVEAVFAGRREDVERIVGASMPAAWPGRALVERAFWASLDGVRADPEVRLWGDRVMIVRNGAPRVVGSVVFHGAPDHDGVVEVAYGVEEESQGLGFATEAVRASVEWALADPRVLCVRATTPPWHLRSRRVLEKCGFAEVGLVEGEAFSELVEMRRAR